MHLKIDLLFLIIIFIANISSSDFQKTYQTPMHLSAFNKKLLRHILYQDPEKNIVISPLSIQLYLSLFYFPATEETRQELRLALNIAKNASDESLLEFVNQKINDLPVTTMQDVNIRLTTVIMGHELNQYFQKINSNKYDSQFVKNKRISVKDVNLFAAGSTNKKMKIAISDNDLKNNPFAILLHTLFLDAKWPIPFNKSSTKTGTFYQNGVEPAEVDMMSMEESMLYGEFSKLNAKMIILPFVRDKLRLYIILPNEKNGLQDLEENILNDVERKRKSILKRTDIKLTLPKIQFQYHVQLRDILRKIGMYASFTKYARFTKMLDDRLDPVFVEVNQRTNFDISEHGSGSVGSLFMNFGSPRQKRQAPTPSIEFTVDHPFLFFVRSKTYIYYIGHVMNVPL